MKVIVTGANSGLGRSVAGQLASNGHDVVLACRSIEKGEAAAAEMQGRVSVARLDLANLSSILEFAESTSEVDVLINNAGVMGLPLTRTVDGFESHIGVNYFGQFALTCALGGKIRDRVICIGSASHRLASLDLEDLNWTSRKYAPVAAYAASKVATMMFVAGLAQRGVRAYVAEPGAAATQIGQGGSGLLGWIHTHQPTLVKAVLQSEADACRCIVQAITTGLASGSVLAPRFVLWGRPKQIRMPAEARDRRAVDRLWQLSVSSTGTDWP